VLNLGTNEIYVIFSGITAIAAQEQHEKWPTFGRREQRGVQQLAELRSRQE